MIHKKLNRDELLSGLSRLDELAREKGVLIDLTVYGGAALSIVYDLRDSTRDVDVAIHTQADKARALAREVSEEKGWGDDWLNDGVKGFLSRNEEVFAVTDFQATSAGLVLSVASPRYLLAMKCMAMRTADAQGHDGDRQDIKSLMEMTGVTSSEEVLDMVASFYPDNQISAKVSFGVVEIFEEWKAGVEKATAPNGRPKV